VKVKDDETILADTVVFVLLPRRILSAKSVESKGKPFMTDNCDGFSERDCNIINVNAH
jgi:hypothetical protein